MSADYFPTACLYRPNYVEWVERHKPYGTKANDRWRLVYVLATDNLFIRNGNLADDILPRNWRLAAI
jgi:hypothetical protein